MTTTLSLLRLRTKVSRKSKSIVIKGVVKILMVKENGYSMDKKENENRERAETDLVSQSVVCRLRKAVSAALLLLVKESTSD